MRKIMHPLSMAIYELDDDGNVRVTLDEQAGTFDSDARWLHGEIRTVDPELCRWVGYGPKTATDVRLNRRFMPVTEAETGEGEASS